jgi:hypothetical protein
MLCRLKAEEALGLMVPLPYTSTRGTEICNGPESPLARLMICWLRDDRLDEGPVPFCAPPVVLVPSEEGPSGAMVLPEDDVEPIVMVDVPPPDGVSGTEFVCRAIIGSAELE